MGKKIYIISTITIFVLIVTIAIYNSLVSGNPNELKIFYPKEEIERVENSIIIDGLHKTNESSNNGDKVDIQIGSIIYDNTFDDSFIDQDEEEKYNQKKQIKKDRNYRRVKKCKIDKGKDLIEQLRKKDKKWHLTSHKIKNDENLWSISRKYKTDHRLIIRVNNIKDANRIIAGKNLLIPNKNCLKYRVKKGDYLLKISKKYKVDVQKIINTNKIKNNIIKIGQTIFIPDAVQPILLSNKNRRSERYLNKRRAKPKKFYWPINGRITSAFGKRMDPITKKKRFHCGIDIRAPIGTPVRASAMGKVIFSGWKNKYGRVIVVRHDNNYITVYAHNKKNIVKTNDKVYKGETIAFSGASGAVTGPHLHFEIRKYLTPLNPLRFLR